MMERNKFNFKGEETSNSNGRGIKKLPPGFRFEPTDEELAFEYLKCKVFSLPPPASIIPEAHANPYQSHPSSFFPPGKAEQEIYFFYCKKEEMRRDKRSSFFASAASNNSSYSNNGGCNWNWKAVGVDEEIFPSSGHGHHGHATGNINNIAIKGIKRTLVLHRGNTIITHWVMHEFRLVPINFNYLNTLQINTNTSSAVKLDKWVLCRVSQKKPTCSRLNQQQALLMNQYDAGNEDDDSDDDGDEGEDDTTSNVSSSSSFRSRCYSAITDFSSDDEAVSSSN